MTTLKYFGRPFDAPMYEGVPEIPTPVGKQCSWCTEPIREGEAGVTMPHMFKNDRGWQAEELPAHIECHLRQALGGLAHLQGRCRCVTGECAHEEQVTHAFQPSHTGMVCDVMVMRDGGGDQCGLPPEAHMTEREEARAVTEYFWGPNWMEGP